MSAATTLAAALRAAALAHRDGVAAFCRDLVRIPSPSGAEERAVRRTVEQMTALGLDEARIDAAGNATGVVRSRHPHRLEAPLLLDSHLDCVDASRDETWRHDPFEGVVADGRLWGRGASDAKSAVAAQVHAAAAIARLRDAGLHLRRDVVVASVVCEEVGGLGTACLLDDLRPAGAVVGEPSDLALAFGHRGRVEAEAAFRGRAGHAARPAFATSPVPSLARFVLALDGVAHDDSPALGRSTAVVTQLFARPGGPNVIPSEASATVDWRHVPGESPDVVAQRLRDAAEACSDAGVTADVRMPERPLVSWTGLARPVPRLSRAFATDPASREFRACREALSQALERDVPGIAWDFASDGGWLAQGGAVVVGFGPGEAACMHARDESVLLSSLSEAVVGNAALLVALDDALSGGAA